MIDLNREPSTSGGSEPPDLESIPNWLRILLEVAKAQPQGVHWQTGDLTPKKAEHLLNRNSGNLKLKPLLVDKYARDIAMGLWDLNTETIKISNTAHLIDGQHRCAAVQKCGITIWTGIAIGMPDDARYTVDIGRTKSFGDLLLMYGLPDALTTSRAVQVIRTYSDGAGTAISPIALSLSKPELLSYALKNREQLAVAHRIVAHRRANVLATPGLLMAACYLIGSKSGNWDETNEFFSNVIMGADLPDRSPMLAARERLLKDRVEETMDAHSVIETVVRAWNFWRQNRETSKIVLRGPIPKIEE